MAKSIVPAFGKKLDETNDVAIKNNVMVAVTDMCKRYANLVDPLLPQITACLQDKSLVVRRTTIITLIQLLQEDYLKMSGRGAFFFRIIQTLNDESEEIRHLSTFYIQQRLIKRKPKVMFHNFVEAVFHFNEYEDHPKYNKFIISEREKKLFSLKGEQNRASRMKLYRFMLEHMEDTDRFETTHRLCRDILNGTVEGVIALDERATGLLQDCFACLASDEIKLSSLRSKAEDDTDNTMGEVDMQGAIMQAAKKTLISQVLLEVFP